MNRRATIEIFPRLTCLKSRVVALVSLVSKVLFCYCVVRIKVYSLGYIGACLLCLSCFISRVVCIQFCLLVAVVYLLFQESFFIIMLDDIVLDVEEFVLLFQEFFFLVGALP